MEIRIAATKPMVALFILLLGSVNQTMAQETRIKCFGHAAFSITMPMLLIAPGSIILPTLKPKTGKTLSACSPGVDDILLTHVHP